MKTHSVRNGQVEIGIVEHQGNTFAAGGSSVNGSKITAYVKSGKRGELTLTRWDGSTILACRSFVAESYCTEQWGDSEAIVFRLTHGRAIVGYSLGDGMLFRGEMIRCGKDVSDSELSRFARDEAEYWLRIDQEDFEQDQLEQE